MVAELVLGVIGVTGALDACIKLGNKIITIYKAYRDTDNSIKEKLELLENMWLKVNSQLKVLGKIWNHIEGELAQSFYDMLQRLNGKFSEIISRIEFPASDVSSLQTKASSYAWKLRSALTRSSLDDLVAELEAWYRRFDPTWYLVALVTNTVIDSKLAETRRTETSSSSSTQASDPLEHLIALRSALQSEDHTLKRSIYQKTADLQMFAKTKILFSKASTIQRGRTHDLLVTEQIDIMPEFIGQVRADVEALARRLQQVDGDAFGLFRCYGLLRLRDPTTNRLTGIEVLYRTATQEYPPITLREHLVKQRPTSLSAITGLARQLVQSVSYVHACNFVHKNIRPENILVFPRGVSPLGDSYLLGFTQFRTVNLRTNKRGDTAWHKNLYHHPQRQGLAVADCFVMQHDIYSLGVCLLEIGMWRSFVWYPDENDNNPPAASFALGFNISDRDFETPGSPAPRRMKEHLVNLAKSGLPKRMGDIYTDAVLACLGCLDAGNEAFGTERELKDEDGIIIGVRYIEKILSKMASICI